MFSYHQNPVDAHPSRWLRGWEHIDSTDMKNVAQYITKRGWSPIIWKNGMRREENFLQASFCVLDFDSGEMSLAEAKKAFCDMRHVIGTTRNHQKPKRVEKLGGDFVCDRFRVVLEFTEPITVLRDYRHTMKQMMKRYPVDEQCKDGARFFYHCPSIESADNSEALMTEDTFIDESPESAITLVYQIHHELARRGSMPRHINNFLDDGKIFGGGRYRSCYMAAIYLLASGCSPQQARHAISSAPFGREKFDESEIDRAIDGALNACSK